MEATGGFSPRPSLVAIGDTSGYTTSITGTMEFDGNGNAVELVKATFVFDGPTYPGNQPVGTTSVTCNYTYVVKKDRSFTMQGNCNGIIHDGIGAGLTSQITGIEVEGFFGSRKEILVLSTTDANVQGVANSSGYQAQRICAKSEFFVRAQ